jgi:hypothetical protein
MNRELALYSGDTQRSSATSNLENSMRSVYRHPTITRRSFIAGRVIGATAITHEPRCATAARDYRSPLHSVVPVFFVPRDWQTGSQAVSDGARALSNAMEEEQGFYAGQLGGHKFLLSALEVVQASGLAEAYAIHRNEKAPYAGGVEIHGNLEEAVVKELYERGYPTPPGQNESGYCVVIFVKGAGGWSGGRSFPLARGGWAILGDWCIDSIQGMVPEDAYWWSGRRKQTGAIAHELGDAFTLQHPPQPEYGKTIMGEWRRYPSVGLRHEEVHAILEERSEFFS